MSLQEFKATDFRCLSSVVLEPDPGFNVIFGENAAGKTSILEAIGYLGRGRSFRGAPTQSLIRHGAREFVLFGDVFRDGRRSGLGARNGPSGLEVSAAGVHGGGAAVLARALPLQVIDPEIHSLVAGGPDERRRYLDWMVFHVERGYVAVWRHYRRALKQRNEALKNGAAGSELEGWDQTLAEYGNRVDDARRRVFDAALPCLRNVAEELLPGNVNFHYRRGWPDDQALIEALLLGHSRDQQSGSTQIGPHRADIRLTYDERQARRLVSRGQQKLLSCAMILGAVEIVTKELEQTPLLLFDDPVAELDAESLGRLMGRVAGLGCQVIATAIEPQVTLFPQPPAMFHVERGALKRVG